MANNANTGSTILTEHRKIVGTRYILAALNFLAVLLGMLVTLFFVSRRGIYDAVLTVIWVLIVINAIQIVLCLGEYILRVGFGVNIKFLPMISYIFGGLWIIALVLEMVLATVEAGTLRTDLLIVAIIQAVVALVAYILWPNLDRRAIDSMIKPSSRGDEKKRAKKAKRYVATYGVLTVLIVLAQAATLMLYKMPPTFYDLFADNRALQYELNEDKDGYIVAAVYNGTSPYVNIPATYNNLPVVGIKKGALVDDGIIEKYKITSITFGTLTKDEEGNEVMRSNLQFINSGAIVAPRVESLAIPESVISIEDGAIRGDAIRTVEYSSKANFSYAAFNGCTNLSKIVMSGENVGVIASLEGMPQQVNIQVDKDIYNSYRQQNLNYVSSFSPILSDDEFCIDFFTGCDYYINSIFAKKGESVKLNYADLKNDAITGSPSPAVDTLAYIKKADELGTDGAKANAAFRGWYYDASYVEKVDFTEFGEVSFTESTKVYAKWINEYNATLNWGSHKPDGQVDKVYWTTEDIRSFPVITDRAGYSAGVVWTKAGTTEQFASSAGITESITLNASWQFDKPDVTLNPAGVNVEEGAISYAGATFVYDEIKYLTLTAGHTHSLQSATGIPADKKAVEFAYEWYYNDTNPENKLSNNAASLTLDSVPETGKYILRVIARSPYSTEESSYTDVSYDVQITKKPLDLGNVVFDYTTADKQFIYNGGMHSCTVVGTPVTQGILPTYVYSKEGYTSTQGVVDAGVYDVVATYAKVDPAEAANYDTATLPTKVTVKPRVLSTPVWTESSFMYDKTEHRVYISFNEAIAGEDVGVIYTGASATDAGNYTAIVTDVSNPNYTLVGVDKNKLSKQWTIEQRPIDVQGWYLDGSSTFTTVYNGKSHEMIAAISGAMAGDEVSFVYENKENDLRVATNAGTYTAKIVGVDNANYKLNVSEGADSCNWEITKKPLVITFENKNTFTYNGADNYIGAVITGIIEGEAKSFTRGDFNYETNSTAAVTLNTLAGAEDTTIVISFGAKNVLEGGYNAKILGLNSESGNSLLANYVITSPVEKSFTVTPKLLNVRPAGGDYVYNGEEQHLLLTVEGVVIADRDNITFTIGEGGDKIDDVTHGVFIDYVGRNAGDYPTSVTAVNDSNYTLNPYTKPLTIKQKEITLKSWTMTDGSTNKTVEWGNGSFVYNKKPYTVGYTLDGVIGDENVTLALVGASHTDATLLSDGNFVTTATLPDNEVNRNYTFAGASTEWRINPRPITLTWKIDNDTKTTFVYSKEYHTPSYTISNIIEGDEILLNYRLGEEDNAKVDAGNYKIQVVSLSNSNYTLSDGGYFTWSITPKPVTVGWRLDGEEKSTVVYNAQDHIVTPVFTGLVKGDETSVYYDSAYASAKERNAKSYTVLATGLTNPNYVIQGEKSQFSWSITPLAINVSWTGGTELVYNRSYQHPTANITNKFDGDMIVITYAGEGLDVGKYTVSVSKIGNTNYTTTGATGLSYTYEIVPKSVKPTWNIPSLIYNGDEQSVKANYGSYATTADDGLVYSGDSLSFTYTGNAQTNAGSYRAVLTGTGNKNYVLVDDAAYTEADWSIAKCTVVLEWDYNSTVYNSEVQYPTAIVKNNHGKNVQISDYIGTGRAAENKGTYTITAQGLTDDNFTLEGSLTATHTYDITPLTLTYEWYGVKTSHPDTARDITKLVYDGYQTTILVRFNNICDGDNITTNYANNRILGAGTVSVTATISGEKAANYAFPAGGITKQVTVAPQPVKITWAGVDTLVYDGAQHELVPTVTARVAGNDSYLVPFKVTVNYGEHIKPSDAGEYNYLVALTDDNFTLVNCEGPNLRCLTIKQKPITVVWGNLNHVYDNSKKTATATLDGFVINLSDHERTLAGSQTVIATAADKNYVVTNDRNTLTIEKAKISVTWTGDLNPTYSGTSKKLDVSISNELNPTILPSYTVKYNNSTSTSVIDAKTYNIVLTLNDTNNYEFKDTSDSARVLVIKPKVVKITGWSRDEFFYDGTEKELEVYLDDANAQAALSYSDNTLTNAGETNAKVTIGSNYVFEEGTVTTHKLKIKRAIVSVSWDALPESVTYDRQYHKLTATLTSNLGKTVLHNYTYNGESATEVINADRYNVVVVLRDTDNYEFAEGAVTSRTLVIEPKTVGISWKVETEMTYKGSSYDLSATLLGKLSTDDVKFYYNTSTLATDAGTYEIEILELTGNASANYKLPTENLKKTYVINPQSVKIVWGEAEEFVYDGVAKAPEVTVIGANDGRNVSFTPFDAKVNVGSYDFTVKLENGNYTLDERIGDVTKTIKIIPRPISVSWPLDRDEIYNGREHKLTPVVSGASGVSISLSKITVEGEAGVNAGVYNFTIVGVNDANYTVLGASNLSASLTILPRELNISWQNLSQTYGMMSNTITFATLENVINGDDVSITVKDSNYSSYEKGNYTLTADTLGGEDKANYVLSSATSKTATLIVNKQRVNAFWSDLSFEYDGQGHAPKLTFTSQTGETLPELCKAIEKKVNSGEYTYDARNYFIENNNYELSSDGVYCSFNITKKQIRSGNFTVEYDAESGSFSVVHLDVIENERAHVRVSQITIKDSLGYGQINGSISGEYAIGTYTISFNASDISYTQNYEVIDTGANSTTYEITEADLA